MRHPDSYAESAELALRAAELLRNGGAGVDGGVVRHEMERASVYASLAVAAATALAANRR